ncbi:MAG: 16S rRNA (guanine(966)-N(2))-methyltransferase RsmD [Campylobacterota bacterium]|nr:16S rRNA (guanine(966)-N(2))-methyltransferase RsmD [Campylobacterota bacterium]
MKHKITTKIISGKYKGKILDLPSLETTRSSKSILKESFFNVLQFDIIDTLFIEGFGGSGSIGLEALSRGAKEAYFCEIDKNSFKILQNNCDNVDSKNSNTIYGDTFVKLPMILEQLKNRDDDLIVYLDPPFDFRDGMDEIYEKTFDMVRNISNNNIKLITFEHMTGLELPEVLGKFKQFKHKKFGKSSLTYYYV